MIARLILVSMAASFTCATVGCNTSAASAAVGGTGIESAPCQLRLEVPKPFTSGLPMIVKPQIRNTSKSNVSLVMPGDGSEVGMRTPVIGWSILSADSDDEHPKTPPRTPGARCGNTNALRMNEIFTLKPRETREFECRIDRPTGLTPGKYRIVFYYSNDPQMKWSGVPLGGEHDREAMRRVKESTAVALISNEVQFEVVPLGNFGLGPIQLNR